ncbi:MAG: cell division protein FtsZ, partial [Mycobacteriales bacterium]
QGLINLDFADVKSVLRGAGSALMGIGSARGDHRAVAAAETAVASPLLEASMDGAHGVLLSISGGSDLGLFEINEAATLVAEAAHPDANIIFGAVIDDALGDEVRITVIAAGFDGGSPTYKRSEPAKRENDAGAAGGSGADGRGASRSGGAHLGGSHLVGSHLGGSHLVGSQLVGSEPGGRPHNGGSPRPAGGGLQPSREPAPVGARPGAQPRPAEFDDDLDIPDFLK